MNRSALLLALLASACAHSEALTPPGDRLASKASLAQGYQLGAGDKLRVTVYNEDGLSGEFTVGADGALSLPLLGKVPASGQTAEDVATQVQTKLAAGYLRDPKVSAEVISYRPFYILGEVKTPGSYPYAIGLTAMNAVATAGGLTARANPKKVYIRRFGDDVEKPYELTPGLLVFPGDTIRLGERYF